MHFYWKSRNGIWAQHGQSALRGGRTRGYMLSTTKARFEVARQKVIRSARCSMRFVPVWSFLSCSHAKRALTGLNTVCFFSLVYILLYFIILGYNIHFESKIHQKNIKGTQNQFFGASIFHFSTLMLLNLFISLLKQATMMCS